MGVCVYTYLKKLYFYLKCELCPRFVSICCTRRSCFKRFKSEKCSAERRKEKQGKSFKYGTILLDQPGDHTWSQRTKQPVITSFISIFSPMPIHFQFYLHSLLKCHQHVSISSSCLLIEVVHLLSWVLSTSVVKKKRKKEKYTTACFKPRAGGCIWETVPFGWLDSLTPWHPNLKWTQCRPLCISVALPVTLFHDPIPAPQIAQ